jgi:hypothetical protein
VTYLGLKAENYLLTCRVESISSPSKSAPRIFQTSPEHPNARIIITPPYHAKPHPVSLPGDIFDPQPPSKARQRPGTSSLAAGGADAGDNGRRTSGRKRTLTRYEDLDSSESDSLEEYSRRRKAQKTDKEQTASAAAATAGTTVATDGPRRRKSSSKLLEATEGANVMPTKKKDDKGGGRTPGSHKPPREKEARLDRRENEELYEALQKQVTIELLKRRYSLSRSRRSSFCSGGCAGLLTICRGIPTPEQEQIVVNICKQLSLETNTDLVSRAITSVRYWVAHKSWRLRDHFKVLGTTPNNNDDNTHFFLSYNS